MDSILVDYSIWLLMAIGVAAILYSSVGHGGASGYLAAMALFGLEPSIMKPAALVMNIFVTVLVLYRSYFICRFNWRLFIPIISVSVPMAFLGGAYTIQSSAYRAIVGILLILAVWRMFWQAEDVVNQEQPRLWVTMPVGGILGFVSGLTGVGGGIFLSPLLLLFRWTDMKGSVPIAAAFIFFNSVAGLSGYLSAGGSWPADIPLLIGVAVTGAVIGTGLAANRLAPMELRRVLGLVLVVAGVKMIMTA